MIAVPEPVLLFGRRIKEFQDEKAKQKEQARIDDELLLEQLGYKQSLNRHLSTFSNFAISFGCCSVLSGLLPVSMLHNSIHMTGSYTSNTDVGYNFAYWRHFSINLGIFNCSPVHTYHRL